MAYDRECNDEPMFPDFLFFRHDGGHIVVDILDPHWGTHKDAAAKPKRSRQIRRKVRSRVWPHRGHVKREASEMRASSAGSTWNRDEVRAEAVTLDEQDNAELRKLFGRYATA